MLSTPLLHSILYFILKDTMFISKLSIIYMMCVWCTDMVVESLKEENRMLLERAEKAEKNILQITNPKDDVLDSPSQNPNAEHSLTYAEAISALKENILYLDTERLKLISIVDLRDSSIALLESNVEKYYHIGEGRCEFINLHYKYF